MSRNNQKVSQDFIDRLLYGFMMVCSLSLPAVVAARFVSEDKFNDAAGAAGLGIIFVAFSHVLVAPLIMILFAVALRTLKVNNILKKVALIGLLYSVAVSLLLLL